MWYLITGSIILVLWLIGWYFRKHAPFYEDEYDREYW